MKTFKSLLGILLSAAITLAPICAHARELTQGSTTYQTSNQPDGVSFYGGAFPQTAGTTGIQGGEVALDWFGNWVPTTTNAQTLGTNTLYWSNAYVNSVTVGTGGVTNTGSTNVNGLLVLGRTNVVIGAVQSQIPITTSYEMLTPTGNLNLTLTAAPTIVTAGVVSGTVLVLTNLTSLIVSVQDKSTLTNSGLRLDSTAIRIGAQQTLTLVYDGADMYWRMLSYGNN